MVATIQLLKGLFPTLQAHLVLDVAGLALQVLADLPHRHRTRVHYLLSLEYLPLSQLIQAHVPAAMPTSQDICSGATIIVTWQDINFEIQRMRS